MIRFGKSLGAVALAASLAGCGTSGIGLAGNGSFQGLSLGAHRDGQAKWTILLHLAAANNLEPFADVNLKEAAAGLTSKDVNFIVLFDGQAKGSSKIEQVVDGKIVTIDDKGAVIPTSTHDIDSGDPKTLAKFVTWATNAYPADHTGLVIWDHGSGLFLPNGKRLNVAPGVNRKALQSAWGNNIHANGFSWSDKTGHHMDTKDVPNFLAAAGKPLDFLGFDACLMSHIEMTYEMGGLSKNLIASEELEPGLGWDYKLWMQALSANPDADGAAVGDMCVKGWDASYAPGGAHNGGQDPDATLANTNYDALKNVLVPAINNFADDMTAALKTSRKALATARGSAQHFYNSDCADLGSFCNLVAAAKVNDKVTADAKAVTAAYKQAVTSSSHQGHGTAGATGQVIYFPTDKWSFNKDYDDASKIAFATEKHWNSFLHAFIK